MNPSSVTKIKYCLVNDEKYETDIKIYVYSEKSIAMTCDEQFGRAFSGYLKNLGTYNGKLKIGKGWIFANTKYPELQKMMSDIIECKVKGIVPVDYNKPVVSNVDGPLGILPTEVPIVSDFRKFIEKLEIVNTRNILTKTDKTYVWGETSDVEVYMIENGKVPNVKVTTEKNSFVVFNN